MATTVQQSAANALASWLTTKLGVDVSVEQRWPDPEKPLPAKAVTILLAGAATDELLQPEVISSQAVPGHPEQKLFRWRVLHRTQPLQLDVWATYDVVRDDVMKRLTDAIHVGNFTHEPVGPGLVLALGDGWSGVADFIFDEGEIFNDPSSVQQSEFRAIYRGEARVDVYIDAVSPKQVRIILQQILDGIARPDDIIS